MLLRALPVFSKRGARTDENLSFPVLDQKHRVDAFKANGVLKYNLI
jgi:hypothetical protein